MLIAASSSLIILCFLPVKKIKRIALLGDSLTQDIQYARNIEHLFSNQQVDVYAKNGASSTEIFELFHKDNKQYDLIIVMWGINNIYSPMTIIEDYKNLSLRVPDSTIIVAVCLLPWAGFSSWTPEYYYHTVLVNKTLRRLENGILDLVIDPSVLMRSPTNFKYLNNSFTEDGLHLNKKGYSVLTDFMYGYITNYLNK
jgi:lysophospholipase L1-like esterase